MIFVWVKRVLIICGLIGVLGILVGQSDDSIFRNLPSESDILEALIAKEEQQKDLAKMEQKRLEEEQKMLEELSKLDQVTQEEHYQKLFDNSIRHTFIFEFTSDEFNGLIADMEAYNAIFGPSSPSGSDYRSNNYRRINVTYLDSEGTILQIKDVGIRTKGNIWANGRRLPIDQNGNVREAHYMLKFNETFDTTEGTEEYQALKSREVFAMENLLFKWNNSYDPAYSNEVFAMNLFESAGVVAPQAAMTEVMISIDGKIELSSLYNVFEHIDDEFVRRYFRETETKSIGQLYKVVPHGDLTPITDFSMLGVRDWETGFRPVYGLETNKSVENHSALIDFTYQISNPDLAARKTYFDEKFATDMMIRSMAMNVLLGNPDDYRGNLNNYYIYIGLDGTSRYIPYDYDNCIGIGWPGMGGMANYTLGYDIYEWGEVWDWAAERPLTDHILAYEDHQILYENYLDEYLSSGLFSYESYQAFVANVDALYGDDYDINENLSWYFNDKISDIEAQLVYYKSLR